MFLSIFQTLDRYVAISFARSEKILDIEKEIENVVKTVTLEFDRGGLVSLLAKRFAFQIKINYLPVVP